LHLPKLLRRTIPRRKFVLSLVPFSLAPKFLLSQQSGTPAPPPPAPVPWTLGLNPKTPVPTTVAGDAIAEADLVFFTPLQMKTLTRLAAVLQPPVGVKPGALDAGTPQFLDFLIGSSSAARKKTYTGGLNWLEAESQRKNKLPFAQLTDEQADALLKPWLRTWMSDHPPTEPHADFVNIAISDIRTATVNSPAWYTAPTAKTEQTTQTGLYWAPIEPDMRGEGNVKPIRVVDAAKSDRPTPAYPR
jgi:hypothetical protein